MNSCTSITERKNDLNMLPNLVERAISFENYDDESDSFNEYTYDYDGEFMKKPRNPVNMDKLLDYLTDTTREHVDNMEKESDTKKTISMVFWRLTLWR